jgi:amino acid transporter
MNDKKESYQLKKSISLSKGVALSVSMVIGSGLLGLPGLALEIGNVYTAAGSWLLISIMLIPLIHIFTYLGIKFTSSAGLAKYAEISLGDWGNYAVSAVLCGTFIIGVPALALIGGAYIQTMFKLSPNMIYFFAIGILILSVLFNLLGFSIVNIINFSSLIVLIALTFVIVVSNYSFFYSGIIIFGKTISGNVQFNYIKLWRTSALLFWAFIGWENLSFSMEEFKNPSKTIPRVYWLSFVIVIFLYLALSITSIGAQSSGIQTKGASGLSSLVDQTSLGKFQLLLMVIVIIANACAWVMSTSRLYYSSGRDGILPVFFAKLTKKGIPIVSLLLSSVFYTMIILLSFFFKISVSSLVLIVSQNFLILYLICIFAYWKTEIRNRRWIISILALFSCGFLLSGFNWWIIYSILLIGIGYCNYFFKRKNK